MGSFHQRVPAGMTKTWVVLITFPTRTKETKHAIPRVAPSTPLRSVGFWMFASPNSSWRCADMKWFTLSAAMLVCCFSAVDAKAGLFDCCKHEPACCAPAPVCCNVAPSCCAPTPHCCNVTPSCCAPACAPACGPTCGPTCGPIGGSACAPSCCAPAPTCCNVAPSCCAPAGHHCCLFGN